MARKPIRTALQFDLDLRALLVVEPATYCGALQVLINIAPGGVRRGQNVTVYLEPAAARELASQLMEVANGA